MSIIDPGPLAWDDGGTTPVDNSTDIDVFCVPPGPPTFIRLLGPVRGIWLHWVGARARPCTKTKATRCVLCDEGSHSIAETRWKGYAPAQRWGANNLGSLDWILCVVEVTERANEAIKGRQILGLVVEMKRADARPQSRLLVKIIERPPSNSAPPPPPFDVTPILIHMWGLDRKVRAAIPEHEPDEPTTLPFRKAVGS